MRISNKLLAGGLIMVFTGIGVTSTILWQQASSKSSEALTEAAQERLTLTRRSLGRELTATRRRIEDQIRTMSASFATQQALRAFSAGFIDYRETGASDARPLADYYNNQFMARYENSNPGTGFSASSIFNGINDIARAMQMDFIANNPAPLGNKDQMSSAANGTA